MKQNKYKLIIIVEVQAEGKLNALLNTTTVIRFACFGKYPICAQF